MTVEYEVKREADAGSSAAACVKLSTASEKLYPEARTSVGPVAYQQPIRPESASDHQQIELELWLRLSQLYLEALIGL
jgi:hypothetical protein